MSDLDFWFKIIISLLTINSLQMCKIFIRNFFLKYLKKDREINCANFQLPQNTVYLPTHLADYINRSAGFGLVSLFNGISTLFRLFNAKAILLEEQ